MKLSIGAGHTHFGDMENEYSVIHTNLVARCQLNFYPVSQIHSNARGLFYGCGLSRSITGGVTGLPYVQSSTEGSLAAGYEPRINEWVVRPFIEARAGLDLEHSMNLFNFHPQSMSSVNPFSTISTGVAF